MKRIVTILFTIVTIILSGCHHEIKHQYDVADLKGFLEEPVTIAWNNDHKNGLQNFQANVQVYRMNNRMDTGASLSETYRLAISTMHNKIVSRIDFNADQDTPAHTVISDGKDIIMINPATEEITCRISVDNMQSPLNRLLAGQSGLSKINLSQVREEAKRLSLDIKEEITDKNKNLIVDIPSALIQQTGTNTITRSRITFDITNEVILETEVVMVREDKTVVSSKVTPLYEMFDEMPIKVGTVTVIDTKAPDLIEGIESDTPIYKSYDDIPTISEEEFKKLQGEDSIQQNPDITFGNPADLSSVETIYELYQDIEINSAPESLFRIIEK